MSDSVLAASYSTTLVNSFPTLLFCFMTPSKPKAFDSSSTSFKASFSKELIVSG